MLRGYKETKKIQLICLPKATYERGIETLKCNQQCATDLFRDENATCDWFY